MQTSRRVAALAALIGVSVPAIAPAQVLGHWEDAGHANTTLAGDALLVRTTVDLERTASGGGVLHINVTTENAAMLDDGTGCVRVALMQGGAVVSSYLVCSARNPARGFNRNTTRSGSRDVQVPSGVAFNEVAFRYFNPDHDAEPVNWAHIVMTGAQLLGGAGSAQ
jgi:hypothetical protein